MTTLRTIKVQRPTFEVNTFDEKIHKGKAVLCITTGEVFKSAAHASREQKIPYKQITHCCEGVTARLKNGNKYCYVVDMPYKADDIISCIVELKAQITERDKQIAIDKSIAELTEAFKNFEVTMADIKKIG